MGLHKMFMAKNYIKEIRTERGLTLYSLAELVGTSHQQISLLEKSQRRLTWDWILRIADALQCHPSDITDGPALPHNAEERELLTKFRSMCPDDQHKYIFMAEAFMQFNTPKPKDGK